MIIKLTDLKEVLDKTNDLYIKQVVEFLYSKNFTEVTFSQFHRINNNCIGISVYLENIETPYTDEELSIIFKNVLDDEVFIYPANALLNYIIENNLEHTLKTLIKGLTLCNPNILTDYSEIANNKGRHSISIILLEHLEELIPKNLYYKDYKGSIDYGEVDKCYYGKIWSSKDLVSYESNTLEGLQKAFEEAVDDYIKDKNNG